MVKRQQSAARRRLSIMERLSASDHPISATALASDFGVSRQIIVGDIALLRASGEAIIATPSGYYISSSSSGITKTIACVHDGAGMKTELYLIVDNGCTVSDVIVEHPVYGQISGRLDLSSRFDVDEFISKLEGEDAPPLSSLTGGIHLHTLVCPDEAAYRRVVSALLTEGILYKQD